MQAFRACIQHISNPATAGNGAVLVRGTGGGTRSGASDETVGGAKGVVRAALLCHREQASVGSQETIRRVSQSTGSECVRCLAEAVVNAGVRNKCDHFPKKSEKKAAVKEGLLRRGAIPGVIGCTDGGLIAIIAPKGRRNTAFTSRKSYHSENCLFICDADMRILTVYPVRPGSDHDSFVWRTTWLRRWFQAGRIANPGVYLIGDSGYPLDPWLLTPVPGHPPMQTAEGKYNTAHATLRSVVERCIGLLMSRFRCLQRYGTFLYEPERAANIVAACAVLHTQPSAV
ncbi:hypothetical protein HPB49_006569 [Dermacentor silvarum]|uniref:Uncharacterized protein n=1 Tax=Dermacentor silvarum TaxID=543639 RepID=A0ACB8CDQ8_DERSI|nr:hypothetical protein HPB49_006569 [Dermacentor silvarum]